MLAAIFEARLGIMRFKFRKYLVTDYSTSIMPKLHPAIDLKTENN